MGMTMSGHGGVVTSMHPLSMPGKMVSIDAKTIVAVNLAAFRVFIVNPGGIFTRPSSSVKFDFVPVQDVI
jgi:hypothetical protein